MSHHLEMDQPHFLILSAIGARFTYWIQASTYLAGLSPGTAIVHWTQLQVFRIDNLGQCLWDDQILLDRAGAMDLASPPALANLAALARKHGVIAATVFPLVKVNVLRALIGEWN